MDLGLMLITD